MDRIQTVLHDVAGYDIRHGGVELCYAKTRCEPSTRQAARGHVPDVHSPEWDLYDTDVTAVEAARSWHAKCFDHRSLIAAQSQPFIG
jgi:hypothetical protein